MMYLYRLTLLSFTFLMLTFSVSVFAATLPIQVVTSGSGVSAWLVEDHTVPVVSLAFQFHGAGSANDPKDLQGLSQLLSNTLDEGAGDLDARTFQSILENKSISLHFHSSRDDFGGNLKTLSKYQDDAFSLLALALNKPRLDQEAVDRMRDANLSRIRSNMTDPEWMAARLSNGLLYQNHPYGQNSGGTLTTLPHITPDALRDKQQKQFGRDNLLITVTGDITPAELTKRLDQLFSSLPAKAALKDVPEAVMSNESDTALYRKNIPQTVVTMILPGIAVKDPDYAAAEVLNFVLGGSGFGSRLTDVIREQRGLTYGIYSNFDHLDHSDTLSISAATKNATAAEVIALTKDVMTSLITTPITDKELKDAKTFLIGSVALELTSTDNISGAMMGLRAADLPANYLDLRADAIARVTKDDVLRVAKRLLKTDTIHTIMVGDPDFGASPSLRQIASLPDVD